MDFVFGFPEDAHKNNGILVFVDRFSKMAHLAAVMSQSQHSCARVFIDTVFRLHGLPRELVSDSDPRFTAAFGQSVFRSLGTHLTISTSDHPETEGQTERVNRVLKEIFRGYVQAFTDWSEFCRWWSLPSTIRACIDNAYTIFRERLTPSTPSHLYRV